MVEDNRAGMGPAGRRRHVGKAGDAGLATRITIMRFGYWMMAAGLAGAVAASGQTLAAPPDAAELAPRGPLPFAALDRNGDGRVTEQEFDQVRTARMAYRQQLGFPMRRAGNAPAFGAIDLNGDGAIDRGEFSAHQQRRMAARGMRGPCWQ
jgi:hypothetical protein